MIRPAGMDCDPTLLRPDIWADTVVLASGKKITVYRCPFVTAGPVEGTGPDGLPVLRFMYAHFVFGWPAGRLTVEVGHGTLTRRHLLWPDQPLTGRWNAHTLAGFGRRWVHEHLCRFTGTAHQS